MGNDDIQKAATRLLQSMLDEYGMGLMHVMRFVATETGQPVTISLVVEPGAVGADAKMFIGRTQ
jgi:acyl CoA:acetate/3-ketoacid CoA transferase